MNIKAIIQRLWIWNVRLSHLDGFVVRAGLSLPPLGSSCHKVPDADGAGAAEDLPRGGA